MGAQPLQYSVIIASVPHLNTSLAHLIKNPFHAPGVSHGDGNCKLM